MSLAPERAGANCGLKGSFVREGYADIAGFVWPGGLTPQTHAREDRAWGRRRAGLHPFPATLFPREAGRLL